MNRKRKVLWSFFCFILIGITLLQSSVYAQAGFNDDRVMLQGFYWESYRHGHEQFPIFGQKKWYEIVREQAPMIGGGGFDLIWLPPPSHAGELSAGYNPKEYFDLNNSYVDFEQHRSMLVALLQNGVEPTADVVINHRDGTNSWAGFKNSDWSSSATTKNNEAFTDEKSEVFETPEERHLVELIGRQHATGG